MVRGGCEMWKEGAPAGVYGEEYAATRVHSNRQAQLKKVYTSPHGGWEDMSSDRWGRHSQVPARSANRRPPRGLFTVALRAVAEQRIRHCVVGGQGGRRQRG